MGWVLDVERAGGAGVVPRIRRVVGFGFGVGRGAARRGRRAGLGEGTRHQADGQQGAEEQDGKRFHGHTSSSATMSNGDASEVGVPGRRGAAMEASERLPQQFNVAAHFVDGNVSEGRAQTPAFHCENRVLTYADVQDLANRTGNVLKSLGVEMESRVLVLCLDTPEFLGAFWGAIKIGAVPIPVNTLMRSADYLYFLDDSRARVAVISAPLLAEVGPVLGQARF